MLSNVLKETSYTNKKLNHEIHSQTKQALEEREEAKMIKKREFGD